MSLLSRPRCLALLAAPLGFIVLPGAQAQTLDEWLQRVLLNPPRGGGGGGGGNCAAGVEGPGGLCWGGPTGNYDPSGRPY